MERAREVFLAKAHQNLAATRLLVEAGLYDAAANRAYYAAYHAALAALDAEGLYVEGMSHDAVQSAFAGRLVARRKRYAGTLRSVLPELQKRRHEADYRNIRVSRAVMRLCLTQAEAFVSAVTRKLDAPPTPR